ncbi:CSLREA domain-containing protein [Acinetobacter haemolyticus]|uniref:CSLREA domain-containing protein n=1 Tax=Acinetobacter haemolyticus TaxID=29430 RepID=A0AAJ2YRA2_ACIHA|nr:CSLREA domain-containing protein [Acinetobacter haemolyticus]NAR17646.1 CSLREA domain-containing protein [Acinetobacter haemolyticus]NAR30229.1 CSLREA domain-containing protein [Acinetobacter haemolyticus]NAR37177.1 CSLREA domain-containing protein [Acinetobacter haemolyticus]NAR62314.1 CSLREA domain-containing protein [Acinetobacter haemolyticus]NAR71929.1 CSLREA domain-containing protein [Acinetobacter haemolyticus]
MKNYKKAVLATMVLASMSLIAATSNEPIKVTTFADEDGENPKACSLREALETAKRRAPYGGCVIKDTSTGTQKRIQLEKGTYTLKRELTPQTDITILGASPVDWDERNVLLNDVTSQYPAQIPLQTTIKAENSRIFNTAFSQKSLLLSNLILEGGQTSGLGGAIYAGGDVSLQSSQILKSNAGQAGGAIYLAGNASSLYISKSLIQGNKAPIGSVLAMHDKNDLGYTQRNITINSSSLIGNGLASSKSMFEFVGEPTVVLESNTIAKNIANSSNGNLIKFTGDAEAGTTTGNSSSVLSTLSRLTLENNTIVQNNAFTTLLYDKLGTKRLNLNIIGYNGDENTYACRYLLGNVKEEKRVGLVASYNAFARSGKNRCDLPDEVYSEDTTKETNIDITGKPITLYLSSQIPASAYTAFLPLYYPINNNKGVIKEDEKIKDLVDTGVIACSLMDQRGLARVTDGVLHYDPASRNTCDIGSVELMRLTAGDISDLTNTSISNMLENYQKGYDLFDDLVKKPNNVDFVTYYKFRVEQYKKILDVFADPEKRKNALKYRAVYIDLRDFGLPLPREVSMGAGKANALEFFNPEQYDIEVEALGVGQINGAVEDIDETDKNLFCEWNADLQQIIMYRIDDHITQAGDKEYCKYTITSIDKSVTSSGLLQAAFVNIAPVVKDTSVTLKYKQSETATLNLLDFANDDGDTGKNGSGPQLKPNKPAFWRNAEGIELPIRLSNVSSNLIITADRVGNCPAPDQQEKCYGGNLYIKEANAFNQFNFSFNYQVYDNELPTPAISNVGTVRVISTANTTDNKRNANSGGGSTTLLSLFGLLGLLAYRRFRK